jgi:mannose-binding lectin 2
MLFTKPWASLCLLAASLTGVRSLGLSEDPDIKAISVRGARKQPYLDRVLTRRSYAHTASSL